MQGTTNLIIDTLHTALVHSVHTIHIVHPAHTIHTSLRRTCHKNLPPEYRRGWKEQGQQWRMSRAFSFEAWTVECSRLSPPLPLSRCTRSSLRGRLAAGASFLQEWSLRRRQASSLNIIRGSGCTPVAKLASSCGGLDERLR